MGRFWNWKLLTGLGLGAGLMYLLDPQQGRRRRAQTWDKVKKGTRRGTSKVAALGRDAAHRTKGLAVRTTRKLKSETVTDETLKNRVRAEMGHHVTNASAVDVRVTQGQVTLLGPILEHEVDGLVSAVASVPGVREVDNRLHAYAKAGEHPDLQGSSPRPN